MYPSPFALTLTGKVDLAGNSTTFTGLPDIPLTDLNVTLDGGAHGLFKSNCATASGTATASLTDQNGDKTASAPASVAVAIKSLCLNLSAGNCPVVGSASATSPLYPTRSRARRT